ncbi:hypothetical protein DYB30_008340, partial [Aphanomyces astaci]
MDQLLTHAKPLLKSGGEEYNYTTHFTSSADQQKHLVRQRFLLWKRIAQDIQASVSIPRPVLHQSSYFLCGFFAKSIDRFFALTFYVDYAADGSVAPIRHVVAQVTGWGLTILAKTPNVSTALLLPLLQSTRSWHACHGALLAIHFLQPAIDTEVPLLLAQVHQALFRHEDEVYGAAAQCLVQLTTPITATNRAYTQVPPIVLDRLWALISADGVAAASVELAHAHVLTALRHLCPMMQTTTTLSHIQVVGTFLKHVLAPVREAAIAWLHAALASISFD